MRHIWTVVCAHAVVDRFSNNASLLHVVEQITVRAQPSGEGVVNIDLELMTLWIRDDPTVPEQAKTRVTFQTSSGSSLATSDIDVDLMNHERSRSRLVFNGLPVQDPGYYNFVVKLNDPDGGTWDTVATIPLKLVFQPPDQVPSPTSVP